MNENIIIEGKFINIRRIAVIIFLILFLVPQIIGFSDVYFWAAGQVSNKWVVNSYGANTAPMKVAIHEYFHRVGFYLFYTVLPFVGGLLIAGLFYLIFFKTELTVTDKRVFGKTSWGKRVDLPMDAISAVGTGILKSISITTASGAIRFALLKNRDEVHERISNLLIDRQETKKAEVSTTIKQEIPQSNADELKKFKELFDSGVITQEEFDAKKKQLLGL